MKDLHEDNLFDSIRERLGRYEEAPSEALWDKIASQQKQSDKVWPVWFEGFSVGVLVMMGVLIWNYDGNVSSGHTNTKYDGKANVIPSEVIPDAIKSGSMGVGLAKESDNDTQFRKPDPAATDERVHSLVTSAMTAQNSVPVPAENLSHTSADSASIVEQTGSSIQIPSEKKEVIPPYKKPKSKFQLYFSLTPSLSFQKMIPSSSDEVVVQGLAHRSSLSMKRFGFGIDAGFQKEINNIFGYYGGLSFYRQHQELTYTYFNREGNVTRVGDDWSFEINRPQHTRTFDYSMTNMGARAGFLVTLKGEKLKHKFGAGLMYSHNLKSSSYLAYQLSYRNEVRIDDRWSWYVEPMFTYSFLSKENLAEPFELKPYRVGISIGGLYRF